MSKQQKLKPIKMEQKIKLKKIEFVTHNVLRLLTEKPEGFTFKPGQATMMAIDKDGLRDEKRPFTFTNLPDDDELEFTIKVYPSHNGMTEHLPNLKVGNQLSVGDVWGAINYQGKGSFIAGGAGVTPFIAILKDLLQKDQLKGNKLFFANSEAKDIIYKNNLEAWLGEDLHCILSDEEHEAYEKGYISQKFLEKHNLDVNKNVYLCGPQPMMDAVKTDLFAMGLPKSHLVTEDGH
jgi:hypothetical protein